MPGKKGKRENTKTEAEPMEKELNEAEPPVKKGKPTKKESTKKASKNADKVSN